MTPITERFIGYALTIAAVVGLVANFVALLFVPTWTREAHRTVTSNLTVFNQTLTTTSEALTVVEGSLGDLDSTLSAVREATVSTSDTLSDTVPLIESIAQVTGDELPATIQTTQKSLEAAQVGASSIDAFLATLAFFGGNSYNPEVTLADSLGQISTNLGPLSESLVEIQGNVDVAGENLVLVQEGVDGLTESLGGLSSNLADAREVNQQYQTVVETQQGVITELLSKIPGWITWGGRAFAGVLLWLAVLQVGMLTQGLELIARSRRRELEFDFMDAITGSESAGPSD